MVDKENKYEEFISGLKKYRLIDKSKSRSKELEELKSLVNPNVRNLTEQQ